MRNCRPHYRRKRRFRRVPPLSTRRPPNIIKVFEAGTKGNLCSRTSFREGDIDQGWRDSDLIFEARYQTQPQAHVSLEPCGALAEMDANGRVTLWSANQSVFRVQANVSESLGMPMSRLRCLTPRIGAGFGNKMEPHIQPITVLLAMKAKRPVKLILSREQDFEMVRARHPFDIRIKTGVKRDGTLIAREVEVLLDGGAFADDSPGVLGYALLMSCGPYRIPHAYCHGRLAYTNKIRFGAFRGFGVPQVTFRRRDPNRRDRRCAWPGPDRLSTERISSARAIVGLAASRLPPTDWPNAWKRCARPPDGMARAACRTARVSRRALGVSCSAHISGLLSTGAIVRLLEDGTVLLNTGSVDIGQGSNTVLSQICAEALSIPLDRVSIASPDTDGSPYNWGTTASRVTYMTGTSVVGAAAEVERKIKDHAAEILECAPADLELIPGGLVAVKGIPHRHVSFAAVSGRAHWAAGGPIIGSHSWVFDQKTVDPKRASVVGLPFPQIGAFVFNATVADVEIDETTGKCRVDRAWSACDVGRAINPQMVEGQIEGAFVQGLGFALFEEMVWNGAQIANPTLMDYKIPTFMEAPSELHAIIVESNDPRGPYGAKSVGEIGINGVAAAITNAVNASLGVRLRRLPLTPQRVLEAMLESAPR